MAVRHLLESPKLTIILTSFYMKALSHEEAWAWNHTSNQGKDSLFICIEKESCNDSKHFVYGTKGYVVFPIFTSYAWLFLMQKNNNQPFVVVFTTFKRINK